MRTSFWGPKFGIVVTLVLAFALTDAQGTVDIAADYVSLDDFSYCIGDTIEVHYGVLNVGDEQSYPIWVELYASPDTTITSADWYLGEVTRSALAVGEAGSGDVQGQFPDTIPPGDYYIGVIADCPNRPHLRNQLPLWNCSASHGGLFQPVPYTYFYVFLSPSSFSGRKCLTIWKANYYNDFRF